MSKYCKDCKWYTEGSSFDWCDSPENGISLVTGKPISPFAVSNRNNSNRCGNKAVWFEEKESIKTERIPSTSILTRVINLIKGE